jgi:ParB family chromosome partitioning protein
MDLTSLSNLVPTATAAAEGNQGNPLHVPLDRIIPGDNPRTNFDPQYLERLAASIKARGVKSPISVKRISAEEARAWFVERGVAPPAVLDGFFQINHGECRYKASSMAGKPSIPAIIDEHHVRVDALVENIQRQDLDPLDIAQAIKRELDHKQGLKKGDIARELGVSSSYVSNHLKLLSLPDPVASMVREGKSKDVTSLIVLANAYEDFSQEISDFCATAEDPTQAGVRQFVATLKEQRASSPRIVPTVPHDDAISGSGTSAEPTRDGGPDPVPSAQKADGILSEKSGARTKRASAAENDEAVFLVPSGRAQKAAPTFVGPVRAPDPAERLRQNERKATDADEITGSAGATTGSVGASLDTYITGMEIRHDGRAAVLLPKMPKERGLAWIRYDGDVQETQIELRTIEEVIALVIG